MTGNEDRNVAVNVAMIEKICSSEKTPNGHVFLLGMAVKACRELATLPEVGDPSTEPVDVCCLGKRVCQSRMGASGCRMCCVFLEVLLTCASTLFLQELHNG